MSPVVCPELGAHVAPVLVSVAQATMRICWLAWSTMKRFPFLSMATPVGLYSLALVALPPLPMVVPVPLPQVEVGGVVVVVVVPATVVMIPVLTVTLRTMQLLSSAKNMFPA